MPQVLNAARELTEEEEREAWIRLAAVLFDMFQSVYGPEYGKDLMEGTRDPGTPIPLPAIPAWIKEQEEVITPPDEFWMDPE